MEMSGQLYNLHIINTSVSEWLRDGVSLIELQIFWCRCSSLDLFSEVRMVRFSAEVKE